MPSISFQTYNSLADVVSLLAEQYVTKSIVKLGGFRSQLQASYVSSYTEELWYNETVCLWIIIIYIYICVCVCVCMRVRVCVINVTLIILYLKLTFQLKEMMIKYTLVWQAWTGNLDITTTNNHFKTPILKDQITLFMYYLDPIELGRTPIINWKIQGRTIKLSS